jgi:hypothetical protein
LFLTDRLRPIDEMRMRAFVSGFDRPLADTVKWMHAGRTGEFLREERGDVPDLAVPRAIVAAAWSERHGQLELSDAGMPIVSLIGAARLGALPDDVWVTLRTDERAQSLLRHRGPLSHPIAVDLWIRALARSPGTPGLKPEPSSELTEDLTTEPTSELQREGTRERIRDLTPEQRDLLAEGLLGGWPRPDAPRALQDMERICDLLDEIERPIETDAQRASVHAALTDSWRGLDSQRPYAAGFVGDGVTPSSGPASEVLMVEPTHAAVVLMQRFGEPEGIAIDRVRAFLARMATPSLVEVLAPRSLRYLTVQEHRYRAAVALHTLMDDARLRPDASERPSLARVILGERILLAAILLVALCLFATLRAHSDERA